MGSFMVILLLTAVEPVQSICGRYSVDFYHSNLTLNEKFESEASDTAG